jgi:hypothetical protein
MTDILLILPYLTLGATLGGLAMLPHRVLGYRKVGGLHFWRIGRLGGSVYIARH